MELNGRAALVTGAGRRVGRAIALALAREGADLAIHYGRSAEAAAHVADEIRRLGRRAETFQADLADPAQIARLFAQVGQVFGLLDVLVNSAAVYDRTPIDTLTAEEWDREMALNARAPALCIRHALPLMASGGAIVNITDVSAEVAMPGYPAYCASKAALLAVTRSAAKALARRGIRVNAVAPGVASWQEGATEEQKRVVLAHIPLGRAGTPEDVAESVVFLCRQEYVTGQTLHVDGGWHMG